MKFNKNNLYIGLKKVIYKTSDNSGICLRDSFGSAVGTDIQLDSDYKQCSIGSDETIVELEVLYNKYIKNRTYSNLGF